MYLIQSFQLHIIIDANAHIRCFTLLIIYIQNPFAGLKYKLVKYVQSSET